MLHELHKLGYQRLRVIPYEGSSGSWRAAIAPVTRILTTHGAWGLLDAPAVTYSEASGNRYFDWRDAKHDTAAALAVKFAVRFPELCRLGIGRDRVYAGWYLGLMKYADRGELPCVLAEGMPAADPRYLPTYAFIDSGLPMPPGGKLLPPIRCEIATADVDPSAPARRIPFSQSIYFGPWKFQTR